MVTSDQALLGQEAKLFADDRRATKSEDLKGQTPIATLKLTLAIERLLTEAGMWPPAKPKKGEK